jgi:hypothetical protein
MILLRHTPINQSQQHTPYVVSCTLITSSSSIINAKLIMSAADDGDPGDAAPVPRRLRRVAAGAPRRHPRRRARPGRRQRLRPRLHGAPGPGAVGRRRAGVRPGEVRWRRAAAAARVPAIRRRRAHLPGPVLRHDRAQGPDRARGLPVRGQPVAGLPALAEAQAHHGGGARRAPRAQESARQLILAGLPSSSQSQMLFSLPIQYNTVCDAVIKVKFESVTLLHIFPSLSTDVDWIIDRWRRLP